MTLVARTSEPATSDAVARLRAMARQRPVLAGGLQACLSRYGTAPAAELEGWADAMLRLANANAGPAALLTAFRVAALAPVQPGTLARLAQGTLAAVDVCRAGGAAAVRAALSARGALAGRLDCAQVAGEAAWWRAAVRLAREAPTCLPVALDTSGPLLARCGPEGYETFVATGLRASADPVRRAAFFALADPEARRVLDRLAGQTSFATEQRRLQAYAAALWGTAPTLRESVGTGDGAPERRASVANGIVRVPDTFATVPAAELPGLFRAVVAHATAHLAFASPRRESGALKPAQIALVGLIEDARVEALAMRRFPGLRRVWAPFHTVEPSVLRTAPVLFARLARALFDPATRDDDGFVAKGRALFAAEPNLADPTLSRRIGGLLGNDIGQMRIQFNAKLFTIEPIYRDDNLGFWVLPSPPPDTALEELDVPIEAVRFENEAADDPNDADRQEAAPDEGAGRARPAESSDDRGTVVARYPEWDRAAGIERPDWTTVREVEPVAGPLHCIEDLLARDPALTLRVERLVKAARVGRPTRLKRQPDGLDLDLDAAIDAAKALRTGEMPDERIHLRKVLKTRDLAVTVLVDTSESTGDRVPAAATTILDVQKHAVAVLAQAMASLGDDFALRAFASNGREEVRVGRIKDFGQPFDRDTLRRLSGMTPGLSTRLGAALRHAGAELAPVAASRRLLIVLTDGAPSDIDVPDSADLVEDARRAVLGLRSGGIDTFGLTLDPGGTGHGAAVFGRTNHMPVRRIEDLPQRLSELYFRVARR